MKTAMLALMLLLSTLIYGCCCGCKAGEGCKTGEKKAPAAYNNSSVSEQQMVQQTAPRGSSEQRDFHYNY